MRLDELQITTAELAKSIGKKKIQQNIVHFYFKPTDVKRSIKM